MLGRKVQRFLAYFWQHKRLTIILLALVLLCMGSIAVSTLFSALWPWFYNLLSIPPNPIVTNNLTLLINVFVLIGTFIGVLIAFYSALIATAAWQEPKSPEPTLAPPTTQTSPIIPTPVSFPINPPVPPLGTTNPAPISGTISDLTNTNSASALNPPVAQIAPVQAALTLSATPLSTNSDHYRGDSTTYHRATIYFTRYSSAN